MNICKIDILNFRGIKNASILVSENAVFVGDNNLGKSTLFEAIDLVMKRILSRNILSIEKSCAFPFNNNLPGLLRLQTKIGWHCCKHFLSATVPICLCFSFPSLNLYT